MTIRKETSIVCIAILIVIVGLWFYTRQSMTPTTVVTPFPNTITPTQEIVTSPTSTQTPESKPESSPNSEPSSSIFSIRTDKVTYQVGETIHVIIRSERSVPEKYYWFVENIHNESNNETRYHRIYLDSPLTLHSLLTNYQFSAKSPGQVRLELVWFYYTYEPTSDEPSPFYKERIIFAICYYTVVE